MKKLEISLLLSIITLSAFAQNEPDTAVLQRNVTIERAYNPVLLDAKKLPQTFSLSNPKPEPRKVVFSPYEKTLAVKSPTTPLGYAPLTAIRRENYKSGFARLAIGVPLEWDATLAYPLVNQNGYRLNFFVENQGLAWGKNEFEILKNENFWKQKTYIETNAALNFQKDFSASALYANLGYENRFFNYYGKSSVFDSCYYAVGDDLILGENLRKKFGKLNFLSTQIGYKALPSSEFLYDMNLGYQLFGASDGLLENQISLTSNVEIPIATNALVFDLNIENLIYSNLKNFTAPLPKTSAVIEFSPRFSMEKKLWDLHLGVKSFFAINRQNVVNIAPDVKFEYRINPKMVSLYAQATGDYRMNSLSRLYSENYYLNDYGTVQDNYAPLAVAAGAKIKPFSGMLIDAFVRYRLALSEAFFVNNRARQLQGDIADRASWRWENRYQNTFTTVSDFAQTIKAAVHLDYNFKEIYQGYLKFSYNHWITKTQAKAWHKPALEGVLGGSAKVATDWRVAASYVYAGLRYAALGDGDFVKMRDIHDLNFSVEYSHSSSLTAFLQVNNLLGMFPTLAYENWYGFSTLGSVMAGVTFSF